MAQNFGGVNFWWITPINVFGGEIFDGSCIEGVLRI